MQVDQVNSLLYEYISDCINLILFHRRCYPAESFQRKASFQVVVPVNRHPQVVQYIAEFVASLGNGYLDKIARIRLCVLGDSGRTCECFEIDLRDYIFDRFQDNMELTDLDDLEVLSAFKVSLVRLMDRLGSSNAPELTDPVFKAFVELDDGASIPVEDGQYLLNSGAFTPGQHQKIDPLQGIDLPFLKIGTSIRYIHY